MVKMRAVVQFFDREVEQIRKVGEEFETNKDRAALLEFRNLAERMPDEEQKARKRKATLD